MFSKSGEAPMSGTLSLLPPIHESTEYYSVFVVQKLRKSKTRISFLLPHSAMPFGVHVLLNVA